MEKEFVPYELALRMKTLGFDESCFGYYVDGELRGINLGIEELGGIKPYYQRFGFHALSNHNIDNPTKIVVTAPTFSQAFRWFREKYNMKPCFDWHPTEKYRYCIYYSVNTYFQVCDFETHEEAELACLEKLIEIIEQKEK